MRPFAPTEFGCDKYFFASGRSLAKELSDERFAATIAVNIRRVEKCHARVISGPQRFECNGIGDVAPAGAELPGAKADLTDHASGITEGAVFHAETVWGCSV